MQCIQWTAERNAVSVPEIDEEHQTIFQLADHIYQAVSAGALLSAIEPELRELIAHSTGHFVHEERMMRSRQYSALAWHKGQHDMVRAKLTELERNVKKGDREAVIPALDFITAWLTTHTAVSDRMLGAFLRTQDLARTRPPHVPATVRTRK